MEQLPQEIDDQDKEYYDSIKESVSDGSYFKDALDWYFFRYVTVVCDRTLLIFGGIVAAIVLYCLIEMLRGAFPLVVKDPIFIKAHDQSNYFPSLIHLKPKKGERDFDPEIKTVDEAVAKYLISVYVNDRESYNFSKAEIEDVNRKFNRVRNNSSDSEYRNFQVLMSRDNPESPINNFGQNIAKTVNIESVRFVRKEEKDFTKRAFDYIAGKIPTNAEVRFVATTTRMNENGEVIAESQRYLAKISFAFAGINKEENGKRSVIKFSVNSYQLFKIK